MEEGKKDDVRQEESAYSGDVPLMSRNKYIIETDSGPMSRKELYKVKDEAGTTLCLAERQGLFYKTISAVGFLFVLSFMLLLIASLDSHSAVVNFILLGICTMVLVALAVILLKPRHLFVFRSGINHEQMLRLIHCKLYRLFIGTYMIQSAAGELLGYLRRNRALSIFRAKMKCYKPDASLLCTIVEPRSVARHVLWWILSIGGGPVRLIYDLNVLEPTESRVIGKFSGRNTIELAREAHIDGRICLAMGLMICSELRVV